jgi:hypothetical protein
MLGAAMQYYFRFSYVEVSLSGNVFAGVVS